MDFDVKYCGLIVSTHNIVPDVFSVEISSIGVVHNQRTLTILKNQCKISLMFVAL